MVIVTGSILAKAETFEELRRLSLAHTQRSRAEPGCVHHAAHIDAENGLRLVFVERWTERAGLCRAGPQAGGRAADHQHLHRR